MPNQSGDPLGAASDVPLRSALLKQDGYEETMSPKCGPQKVVSIADPEASPVLYSLNSQPPKQFSAGLAKRLGGRRACTTCSQSNMEELPEPSLTEPEHRHTHDSLLSQVTQWLQAEKAKRAAHKATKTSRHELRGAILDQASSRPRSESQGSDSSTMSLERLQRILEENMPSSTFGTDGQTSHLSDSPRLASQNSPRPTERRPSMVMASRRRSSKLGSGKQDRNNSSDTEYYDGDVLVPTCDVALDNSKTLSYSGGATASSADLSSATSRADKEQKAWSVFKSEILRLAHTLRLKGWRRVPLERSDDIKVERLSGALTNAVYVVSPSSSLASMTSTTVSSSGVGSSTTSSRKPPPKLLLRIYGPQVEHLIDRENELGILRRLARKKIGPRLLGTFSNGRFEEYFDSTTLTSQDLRVPETSRQIAKRMRELHEGIELLAREREEGPFVWRNWDKWVDRCEKVVAYLDARATSDGDYICGVEWKVFRGMVDKYRLWLDKYYGGSNHLHEKLVFAHNDTQYGNILRLLPLTSESPLLLPANTHKQLIVIDFEYASANTPGLEFANHFTEWCYNYHDTTGAHKCRTENYPTPQEQRNFIRSYVNHRPQFNARASATPKLGPREASVASIKDFMLDSRTPGGAASCAGYDAEEATRLKAIDDEVEMLVEESRIWRIANSAQWVAWGIVQAKVPELDETDRVSSGEEEEEGNRHPEHIHQDKRPEGLVAEAMLYGDAEDAREARKEEEADGDDEFDYLSYARERALFFWADCVELGLIKKEELPGDVRSELKVVAF